MAEIILTENPTAEELRAAFVAAARSLVGAHYQHRGRDPEAGLDCLGVVIVSARRCGFETFDYFYDLIPADDILDAKLSEHMIRLPRWQDARAGDVITRRYRLTDPAKHCGVVTLNEPDHLRCVHATRSSVRRVCETRWPDPAFNSAAYRMREIAALEMLTR